jgi:hypothetical protein
MVNAFMGLGPEVLSDQENTPESLVWVEGRDPRADEMNLLVSVGGTVFDPRYVIFSV